MKNIIEPQRLKAMERMLVDEFETLTDSYHRILTLMNYLCAEVNLEEASDIDLQPYGLVEVGVHVGRTLKVTEDFVMSMENLETECETLIEDARKRSKEVERVKDIKVDEIEAEFEREYKSLDENYERVHRLLYALSTAVNPEEGTNYITCSERTSKILEHSMFAIMRLSTEFKTLLKEARSSRCEELKSHTP